jgi:PncC family amidohydrolase
MGFSEHDLVTRIGNLLLASGKTLGSAESCTGGLVGAMLTSVPGSSGWYRGGVTAYSDEVKERILNVPADLLAFEGAVSRGTAAAMADGVRRLLGSDISISITGIAGPGGGSREKPVGTVWMAVSSSQSLKTEMQRFAGNRNVVRKKAADYLLTMLYSILEEKVR